MAWIYLAESEDSVWPWTLGSEQSPTVNVIVMPNLSFCPECGKEDCPSHQYGTMWDLSPVSTCPAWTSSPEDSLARTSALRELERAWREADQAYFSKSFGSLANYDHDSFSWKTSQLSLFGGLTEFSWSSLRWGTTVDGRLYQPQRWEPLISESDGSYLPTPLAQDSGTQNNNKGGTPKPSLDTMARKNLWPTPTVCGNYNRAGASPSSGDGLATWVKRWPTPRASEASRGHGGLGGNRKENQYTLSQTIGGQLNPTWVEWLMGYPSAWTVLDASATQWFRSKRERPSKDLSESKINKETL